MLQLWILFSALAFIQLSLIPVNVASDVDIQISSMDEAVYERWASLSLLEKLPYLLDQGLKSTLNVEYLALVKDGDKGIVYKTIAKKLTDFHTEASIRQYFDACDSNQDGYIDFIEYVTCRGYFDTNGNEHGVNEYDILESIIIYDYEQKRNDPFIQQAMYKYDADGIIVD